MLPLERRLFVRLFYEVAPAVLGQLAEILWKIQHLAVVSVVVVLVLLLLRLLQLLADITQQAPRLPRSALRTTSGLGFGI